MAVFRVERNTGYTVMSNHHLRNKELTLKAKGLLSQMLSLPEDWDYTLAGLSYINRESIDAIRTAVWELEKAGYITRRQGRDEKGKMTAIEYTIYEQPQSPGSHSPGLENADCARPGMEPSDRQPGRKEIHPLLHNPHALASYLTALLQSYTPQSAQAELERIFDMQYTLTLTEEVEIRYRTETSTDPETGETTTEEVPYEYYILSVSLTNRDIATIAPEVLTAEQLQMFRVYLETSGNKPLLFGGGSADTSASEDLSGVQFVNGTRPGNPQLVEIAKRQVGNVGGAPYWSWYGFDSRVAWCACFVSWCYGQAGLSEPRFAACQSQGVPWFTSHGQWGARGYENIAPGDAIFFDWDLDGSADHVGLVIGTDGNRVYTIEGNSGDACKIKSYPLDYACIKGYGLMNWN